MTKSEFVDRVIHIFDEQGEFIAGRVSHGNFSVINFEEMSRQSEIYVREQLEKLWDKINENKDKLS